ncbi:hypothetical protein [Mucilaginibacter sp. L3T2-6]|uniref:hypothetical protein n=1 Tax=Mucilaginibacter sp. L3T2-6 TaxID=3062491 RepID=UPI002676676D|nr:hypothetical protein [Mucilaginibacter sp. L3T2-6]MDO3645234.1 hypothetical protein [Mucilaginibacter sp. L3T2-6]MDV6217686.1 hypothetical protein [Mucilaginibacter sp. L3T2-6]
MKALKQYYRIKYAAGLNITVEANDSGKIALCAVKIEGKLLTITKRVTGVDSLLSLQDHIPTDTPLALAINGKIILHKKIERIEDTVQEFSKILPNGKPEDFYIQKFDSGDFSFISLIRKVEADKWIRQIEEAGFELLSLSLGPFPADIILPQLNVYGEEVIFDGHNIRRNDNQNWKEYKSDVHAKAIHQLKIETEPIDESLVIPYSVAFQLLLLPDISLINALVPTLDERLKKKLTLIKIKTNGFISLSAILLLLLLNFFVLSTLNSANTKMAAQLDSSSQSEQEIKSLADKVVSNEKILNALGWEGGINKAGLIDEISSMLPQQIILHKIAVDPINQSAGHSGMGTVFNKRTIQVDGDCKSILPVNEWIARLKTRGWIRNIELKNYKYSQESDTGFFSIFIYY